MPTNRVKQENVRKIIDFVYAENKVTIPKVKLAKIASEFADSCTLMLDSEVEEQLPFILEELENV